MSQRFVYAAENPGFCDKNGVCKRSITVMKFEVQGLSAKGECGVDVSRLMARLQRLLFFLYN